MKLGIPWTAKGIRPEARATAKEAARRSGMSLDDWLNSVILQQAAQAGMQSPKGQDHGQDDGQDPRQDQYDPESYSHELGAVHQRLDNLSQRIENFSRKGPAAYAPRQQSRGPDPHADLIGRLDQYVNTPRPAASNVPSESHAPANPRHPAPLTLDRALAEIADRQRALNEHAAPRRSRVAAPEAPVAAPPYAPTQAPLPTQDLSGLEEQLRNITNQIETLRQPGIGDAINALRAELGDIGRALQEAMPRRAIEAIEAQIQNLAHRIAEGRENGVDHNALAGIEHGLTEVREALRGLTPAENLVGFNEAVTSLAQRIDLIIAQKDPATLAQLENAITTLRGMANHVASSDAVSALAAEVQSLAEKIEEIARTRTTNDVLTILGSRIDALAEALATRAQNDNTNAGPSRLEALVQSLADKIELFQHDRVESSGDAMPPRLEALLQSLSDRIDRLDHDRQISNAVPQQLEALLYALSDKIDQVQQTRPTDDGAAGHLENRIAALVERLDASNSRFGQLEGIERTLTDVLAHLQHMPPSAEAALGGVPAFDAQTFDILKEDLAQAQDALKHDIAQAQDALKYDIAHAQDLLKYDITQAHDVFKDDLARSQDSLKDEIVRTQDTLDQVNGMIGQVVDRLATIERNMIGERHAPAAAAHEDGQRVRATIPTVEDAPATAFDHMPPAAGPVTGAPSAPTAPLLAVQPPPMPAAPQAPEMRVSRTDEPANHVPAARGSAEFEPRSDEPLEPGSGPPRRANSAARIAASEAALGQARPGSSTNADGKSNFIAAARRAAQAAMQNEAATASKPKADKKKKAESGEKSLSNRMMRRMKSLFVAASIVAIVVGSVQIAATMLHVGKNQAPLDKTAHHVSINSSALSALGSAKDDKAREADTAQATVAPVPQGPKIAATPLAMTPPNASIDLLAPPDQTVHIATVPAKTERDAALQPSEDTSGNDITGSIPEAAAKGAKRSSAKETVASTNDLPTDIGSSRLRQAALAGDSAAAYEIAMRFAEGRGVTTDLTQAAHWFERAADKGLAPAQFRYASLLEKGQGVPKDLLHASRLYLAAARQGNAKAMHNLAVLYAEGVDGKPDYQTAARWFTKAAQYGVSDSQYNLGILCARGIGVGKSLPEAYKWFALAAKHGDTEAGKKRDEVAKHMDAKSLAAARDAVTNFVATPQPAQATTVPAPSGGWDKTTAAPQGPSRT